MNSVRHSEIGSGLYGSHVDLDDIAKGFSECYASQLSLGPNTVVTRIGKGFGYCSVVVRIDADWVGQEVPKDIPNHFIVKIPAFLDVIDETNNNGEEEKTPEEIEKEKIEWEEWVVKSTNHEINFYQWSKKYKWKLPIPEMVAYMKLSPPENLTKGFIAMKYCPGENSVCRFDYVSVEEMEQIMRGFAGLASGYVPISSEDQKYCKKHDNCRPEDDAMRELKILRDFGVSSELMDQFEAILPELIARKDEIFEDGNRGITPVIIHSDAWTSNVLMTGEGFGQRTFAKIIDFQYFHLCNPVEDLIQIITTCVTFDVRIEHTKRLLRAYYDEMERLVEVAPCTWEQLQYSYDKLFVHYATKVIFLYHTDQCGGDPWKLQRAKEKIEGILEEILIYYNKFMAEK